MSAGWRAVAAWFARAFHWRGPVYVQPWNAVSTRAMAEDIHLPFEAYSLAPTPEVLPDVTAAAAPTETAAADGAPTRAA